ncbi:MAG: PA14 domain-containing protein [Pseudomonadota bacterium]
MFFRAALLTTLLHAVPVAAEPLQLAPADPQPDAAALSPGLAVSYAYPGEVRTLEDAAAALSKGRAGPPLRGLSYEDNNEGDLTLTSKKDQKVAAQISGFIRFEVPGSYTLNVFSNDGITMILGEQQVAFYDGVHACEPAGEQEVLVPQAGWYALEATYFQRKGTACLIMDWVAGSSDDADMVPVPDTAFSYSE